MGCDEQTFWLLMSSNGSIIDFKRFPCPNRSPLLMMQLSLIRFWCLILEFKNNLLNLEITNNFQSKTAEMISGSNSTELPSPSGAPNHFSLPFTGGNLHRGSRRVMKHQHRWIYCWDKCLIDFSLNSHHDASPTESLHLNTFPMKRPAIYEPLTSLRNKHTASAWHLCCNYSCHDIKIDKHDKNDCSANERCEMVRTLFFMLHR